MTSTTVSRSGALVPLEAVGGAGAVTTRDRAAVARERLAAPSAPAAGSVLGWGGQVQVMVSRGAALPAAQRIASAVVADVERAADRFRRDAELHALPAGRPRRVSPTLLALLDAELEVARATGGLVDPTLASTLDALGYDRELALVMRRASAISPYAVRSGAWREIVVDAEHQRVTVPARCRLDLGAAAGAWAADETARRVADELGVAVVAAVGHDIASAVPAWEAGQAAGSVEVDLPAGTQGGRRRIELTLGESVSSVSRVARRWQASGQSLHDIIDPRNGQPVSGPMESVTVVGASAVQANLWSLAALVAQSPAVAEAQPGLRVVHVATT